MYVEDTSQSLVETLQVDKREQSAMPETQEQG